MPKPNKSRSNTSKPQNNDRKFSVGIQILQVHPRLVMTAEMLLAGEHHPSFAHITDCYDNISFATPEGEQDDDVPADSLQNITYGRTLYTKNKDGELVPYAREVGGTMWVDIHFKVLLGYGDASDLDTFQASEAIDVLVNTNVEQTDCTYKLVYNDGADLLDPDYFGDEIEDIAKQSKVLDIITRHYEKHVDPDSKMLPKALRREMALDNLLNNVIDSVCTQVLASIEELGDEQEIPAESFEVFSGKMS